MKPTSSLDYKFGIVCHKVRKGCSFLHRMCCNQNRISIVRRNVHCGKKIGRFTLAKKCILTRLYNWYIQKKDKYLIGRYLSSKLWSSILWTYVQKSYVMPMAFIGVFQVRYVCGKNVFLIFNTIHISTLRIEKNVTLLWKHEKPFININASLGFFI